MALIESEEAAKRLARVILSDIELYSRERPQAGETLDAQIEEGRRLFGTRVSPAVVPLFDVVLADRRAAKPSTAPSAAPTQTPSPVVAKTPSPVVAPATSPAAAPSKAALPLPAEPLSAPGPTPTALILDDRTPVGGTDTSEFDAGDFDAADPRTLATPGPILVAPVLADERAAVSFAFNGAGHHDPEPVAAARNGAGHLQPDPVRNIPNGAGRHTPPRPPVAEQPATPQPERTVEALHTRAMASAAADAAITPRPELKVELHASVATPADATPRVFTAPMPADPVAPAPPSAIIAAIATALPAASSPATRDAEVSVPVLTSRISIPKLLAVVALVAAAVALALRYLS
ncbi:MAG: hypothetical protein ABUL77_02100 [Bacteroidota bacterium]